MTSDTPDSQLKQTDAHRVIDDFNPLPRSVVRRTPFVLLDGEWKFDLDLDAVGVSETWHVEHNYKHTARFPSSVESQLKNAHDLKDFDPAARDSLVVWYEREFVIPPEWCSLDHCLTQLTFGACGYETRVWLNGSLLKTVEGEEIHCGEYNSFSYEMPRELLQPVNRLTVRVADSLDADIPRGKQASRVYKQGGIWYQAISGAVRSVWIEPVESNRLRSRVSVTSSLRNRLVEFDFTPRIHDAGNYVLRLTVTPHDAQNSEKAAPLVISEFPLTLEAGEKPQRVPLEIPDANIWSPSSPNLYHLLAQLISSDGTVAGIETHFGLRKIEARGRYVYLNNETIYLDGILYQPGTSSFEEIQRHFHAMKRLGCNLVRVHIAGIDPRIYHLADQMGMLLWVEIPSPHSSTQLSRDNHWAELQRMLVFIASHPSIVILSLYNEDWGAEDIRTNIETRRYIASTFDYLRNHVPQILVVDNDGWNHVSRRGRLKSHLMTAHVYTPDPSAWATTLDRLGAGETEGVTAQPLVVGDPYFYRGQVPLIISEWGGFGFTMYGGPGEGHPDERAERIRTFKHEMRRRPIAGDIYTQATSIEDENNGIIDPASGELLVPPGTLDSRLIN
ncbi:MAG: sugar-binding domain-containing protein [Pyrinomonadaceae bacterium]